MALVFDMSEWQPSGSVDKILRLGAKGVILRMGLTYGGVPDPDRKFKEFLTAATNAGLPFGVYYYNKFTTDGSALVEAQYMNDKIWEFMNCWGLGVTGSEPPLGTWFDIEDKLVANQWTNDIMIKTIKTMRSWGFKNVGIYSGYYFFHDYFNLDELEDLQVPLWVAQYNKRNNLKEERPGLNIQGWQFTEAYDGNSLDANEWYTL